MKPSASQRGILNPHEAPTRFHLERHLPSAELSGAVERYWIIRWDLRGREPFVQETLPHPCVNVVFEAGRSGVHGVSTERFAARLEGQGQVFGVKFRPGAFAPFVGFSMAELTDRPRSVGEVFGEAADRLAEQVLSLDEDRAQIALVEAFFRERLPAPDPSAELVLRAVTIALEAREVASAGELAERSGLSLRALQRLFRHYVGVSPKWVIRRFRIHEAAERVAQGRALDWAALAQELGYFDQAHFIKDFRAQIGRSPSEYATLCAAALGRSLAAE